MPNKAVGSAPENGGCSRIDETKVRINVRLLFALGMMPALFVKLCFSVLSKSHHVCLVNVTGIVDHRQLALDR